MWIGADDDESVRALRAVDLARRRTSSTRRTATATGTASELVGQVVRESAETVYVATKIPPKNRRWPAPAGVKAEDAFPADWIVKCTEESLERLGLETIDVQQFHVWSDEWVGKGDWLDGVEQLKRDGKIRFFGVSINDHQPVERGPARRVRPCRHRPGDLQRLRPEPRGRALPGGARRPTSG